MAHAPKPAEVPDVRVDDPAEAMRKAMDFGRRILAVPKAEVAKTKPAQKEKRKSR